MTIMIAIRRSRIVMTMMMMLTFWECKSMVAILQTSDSVERAILPRQVVGRRFLQMTINNDHNHKKMIMIIIVKMIIIDYLDQSGGLLLLSAERQGTLLLLCRSMAI